MARTAGPRALGFDERLKFGPVRVVARLRQEGSAPARHLADRIEADIKNIPQLVAAEMATMSPRCPFGEIGGRTRRITPALLGALFEMQLRLELSQSISAALAEHPEWSGFANLA